MKIDKLTPWVALGLLLFLSLTYFDGESMVFEIKGDPPLEAAHPQSAFIENRGQLGDPDVDFYNHGPFRVHLGPGFLRYGIDRQLKDGTMGTQCFEVSFRGHLDTIGFGIDRTSTTHNFYFGSSPSGWFTDVRSYREVIYENLYEETDLVYRSHGKRMKYDIVLKPGSDPERIVLDVVGHESLRTESGDLIVELMDGTEVRETGLITYYQDNGDRISSRFELIDENSFTFSLSDYDRSRAVVIDPVVFSTFIGGAGSDKATGMMIDNNGDILISGNSGRDFPITPGVYKDSADGNGDATILRISSDGSTVMTATYIGGDRDETGYALQTDDSGNIYITGRTSSSDYPASPDAYSRGNSGGYDIFVSKLNYAMSSLLFSTYVGGASVEYPNRMEIDVSGNPFVAGTTSSLDFPLSDDPVCSDYGGGDISGFLFKLKNDGSNLIYSTYISGEADDSVTGLAVDSSGCAFISGMTRSTDFTVTAGAFDTIVEGNSDGYIMKVSQDGKTALISTYFGGISGDGIYDLRMDDRGNIFVVGLTYSDDIPTTTGVISADPIGSADLYIAKFDSSLNSPLICTYFGSSEYEKPLYMSIDSVGRILVQGETQSNSYPVSGDAFMGTYGGGNDDGFISVFNGDLTEMTFSTYFGGSGHFDEVCGVGTDENGVIFAAGSTDSTDYPTTSGAYMEELDGFEDHILLSVSLDIPPGPPKDLSAESGDKYIKLAWEEPDISGTLGIDGYDIYKGVIPGKGLLEVTLENILEYNDTNVENGLTYYYSVRTRSIGPDSIPSVEISATPVGPPTVPLNFKVEAGIRQAELSWEQPLNDGGAPIISYLIEKTWDEGSDDIKVLSPLVFHTDLEVNPGKEYSYSISAYNGRSISQWTDSISVIPISIPDPPDNFTCNAGDGYVDILWSVPQNTGGLAISEYNIYRSIHGGDFKLLKMVSGARRSFNDTSAENGVDYTYRMTSVNEVGESAPTLNISVKPITIPSQVKDLKADYRDGSIILTWSPPLSVGGSAVTGYELERTLLPDNGTLTMNLDRNVISFTDEDIVIGSSYSYRIRVQNGVGPSDWSGGVLIKPLEVPGSPDVYLHSFGWDHVHLNWTQPVEDGGSEILIFQVFRGTVENELELLSEFEGNVYEYNDTTVTTSIEYFYGVSAVNVKGHSPIERTLSCTPLGIPNIPKDLKFILGDRTVSLSWNRPQYDGGSEIKGYTIERTQVASGTIVTMDLAAEPLTYLDEDVDPGQEYLYRVCAETIVGTGPYCDHVSVIALKAPYAVTGLSLVRSKDGNLLSWDPVDLTGLGDLRLEIWRSTGDNHTFMIGVVDGTQTTFEDLNIRVDARYSYHIISVNPVGTSQASQKVLLERENAGGAEDGSGSMVLIVILTVISISAGGVLIFLHKRRNGNGQNHGPYSGGTDTDPLPMGGEQTTSGLQEEGGTAQHEIDPLPPAPTEGHFTGQAPQQSVISDQEVVQ